MCVSEPPSIQERPEVVRVARGDPVRLEGRVSGSPQVSVRWSKEGKTLDSYRKYQLFHEGNLHRLSFEFCELEDQEAPTAVALQLYSQSGASRFVKYFGLGALSPILLTVSSGRMQKKT